MVKDISNRRFKFKNILIKTGLYGFGSLFILILSFFTCNYLFPLRIDVPYSQTVYDGAGNAVHAFLSKDQKWRLKVRNDEISPLLKKVFIAKEDQYFYSHYGINISSIARALFNNLLKRKKTSGASTITMQVARLLAPKKRTYGNKFIEAFRAIQLESKYSKDEILNMYFNLIPYGGNVEGIKSVSLLYLQKNPQKLSLAEAVALAIIPNRPSSLNIKKNYATIVTERNKWLLLLQNKGIFSQKDVSNAIAEPFVPVYKPLPYRIPHLAIRLRKENPHVTEIHSHIVLETQYRTAEILRNYVQKLKKYNIYNGAAMVVDNKTHQVVSYVGSNDFFDEDHAGQCDGVHAIRSPGSTLKPLLYALAFDKGQLTFQTTVEDIPCEIKGYAPQNFDKKFRGKITIETALLYSLNIPAVKIIDEYEVKNFVDKLVKLNFKQIKKDKDKLGHSVILGGCGATLEEITQMYTAFANIGKFKNLELHNTTKNRPLTHKKEPSMDMVSPAAAYMVTETLSNLTRPDIPNYAENMENNFNIAWKTGTSYGKRDAWCMGYTPQYTVGVWLGNFDNSPVAELVGVELAAPVLFEIFKAISNTKDKTWYHKPQNLSSRIVCTESGLPPNYFCKSFTNDWFLAGVSKYNLCEHLKEYDVSANEKISYCKDCVPETGYKKLLYSNLSADLINYYDNNHVIYKKIPEHNPLCQSNFNKQKISILHPQEHKIYYTDEKEAHIKLECAAASSVKHIYWYVNDKFIGKYAKNEEVFIKLKPQKAKISCTDDLGNTKHVEIEIQGM